MFVTDELSECKRTEFFFKSDMTKDYNYGGIYMKPWLHLWNGWQISPRMEMEMFSQRKTAPPSEGSGIEVRSPKLAQGIKLEGYYMSPMNVFSGPPLS